VEGLAFSPNGQTLAIGDFNGVELLPQRISDGNVAVYSHIICGEIRGNMTKPEWSNNVPDQPYHKTCPGDPLGQVFYGNS
jgi:hypothetical protein